MSSLLSIPDTKLTDEVLQPLILPEGSFKLLSLQKATEGGLPNPLDVKDSGALMVLREYEGANFGAGLKQSVSLIGAVVIIKKVNEELKQILYCLEVEKNLCIEENVGGKRFGKFKFVDTFTGEEIASPAIKNFFILEENENFVGHVPDWLHQYLHFKLYVFPTLKFDDEDRKKYGRFLCYFFFLEGKKTTPPDQYELMGR